MRLSLVYWLIAAALVGNAAVYVWSPAREPGPEPAPTNDLRSLKLLSELDEMPVQKAQPVEPVPAAPPPATPAEGPELAGSETEQELSRLVSVPESGGEVPSPVPPDERVAVQSAGEPSPEMEPLPEAEPEPEPQPEPEPEPPRCWLAGPVENEALSEQLAARFAAAGTGMDLVLRTVEVSPDNWVYLPTSGSQADVRRLSRELRQSGFDNFPITDGPLAGSLSLGLFRSEERAIALRNQLQSRGYVVEIFPRPAFREQPWAAIDDQARDDQARIPVRCNDNDARHCE